ncbi:anhydro-N-acetylmuramic acid kinase [Uliginosibacterium sp. sgz301328]|uniref:anhydro-N-acetylmuramic acid kinase n=1 Tax=Uliginosibacterium sp. sgz301328 TaxID=3243764 RepID=UPI00359EB8AD
MTHRARFIGLMSGTSLDGVDAVVATNLDAAPRIVASHHLPFPTRLREQLLSLNRPREGELQLACELSVELAEQYARATHQLLESASLSPSDIVAIGCHGQTVRHRPERGFSLQLNQPALIAERCGIDVIADFRNRDIAAGGQGAPLVPAFHREMLGCPSEHRVVLNLGGIANITDLPAHGGMVRGFDTGPANALLDGWTQAHRGLPFDEDGSWARSGQVVDALLRRMLAHPFFSAPPPKSCGREEFSIEWLRSLLQGTERPEDVQATLLELTARSVTNAIEAHCGKPARLLVCGGGGRNGFLMARLAVLVAPGQVALTDAHGIPGQWMEAFAFAWLAHQCVTRRPGNLPSVTGAAGPRILGAIYPA